MSRLRSALVVGEVALAVVLAVAATLLARTFVDMIRTDPGFRASHVLTFELTLPPTTYPDQPRMARTFLAALDQLGLQPQVEAVGMAQVVPMGGAPDSTTFRVLGRPAVPSDAAQPYAAYTVASPGYFSAIGVPVLSGRDLLATDTAESMRVVVINRTMATRFFPHEDPIGKQVDFANSSFPPMTIVGVAGDSKQQSLRETPMPRMYAPLTQKTWTPMQTMQVALRTRGDSSAASAYVREAIRRVDPDLPVSRLTTLEALVDASTVATRFAMLLLGGFGALALLLASVGLYALVSYSVAQRTREIGIRIAVGAGRRDIVGMVLAHTGRLAVAGIALGVAAALAATRVMSGFLYGVAPTDPATFAGVAVALACVAAAAAALPALRAMRIDPIAALRSQ